MARSHTHHDHDREPDHGHDHDHSHDHHQRKGLLGWLGALFHFHGHGDRKQDWMGEAGLADTEEGIRTVWLALAALGVTTLAQILIVLWSGSVALLADTVHNFGDALNSIPLLIALYLARRAATRRYTYGYGRAEDVAGVFIVLSIAVSAAFIFYESFRKLIAPAPMQNLGWVAAAAVIGFLGNEVVAMLQIRTGKRIGSAAMVADGQHARTDGLTSLAVLIAVGGTWLGYPIVDPIIGLLIGVTILFITWDATKQMWYRLMDAVDPDIVDEIETTAAQVAGVQSVGEVKARWIGHALHADVQIIVDEDTPVRASHAIADEVRHRLGHALPKLATANVTINPCGHGQQSQTRLSSLLAET
jgi:cation diffusion facilitator family transporter